MAKSTKRIVLGTDKPRTFRMPLLKVFRDFSCYKAHAGALKYDAKSRHGPHPSQVLRSHLSA
jgi:hypothetical protein